jgi:hypothetical protein
MARRDGSVPGGERRHHVREARSTEPPLPRLDFSSNRVRHDPNAYNVFRTRRRTPDLCRLRSADPPWQDRAIAHRSDQQWNLTPRDELHRVDWRSGRSAYRQQRPRDDRNGGIRRHGQGSARDGDWCRPQRTADAVSRQQDARITMVRSRGRKCPMRVSDTNVQARRGNPLACAVAKQPAYLHQACIVAAEAQGVVGENGAAACRRMS